MADYTALVGRLESYKDYGNPLGLNKLLSDAIEALSKGDIAHLAVQLGESARVPEGFKLVRIDPDEDMEVAGMEKSVLARPSIDDPTYVRSIFRAMLDASPTAQTQPDVLRLLREARVTLEMWKDVAPAVSLCADIDRALGAPQTQGLVHVDEKNDSVHVAGSPSDSTAPSAKGGE